MIQSDCTARLIPKVKEIMASIEPGHDFFHIQRVMQNAEKIHQTEGGCITTILLSALLHELPDPKFFDPSKSEKLIIDWLSECNIDLPIRNNVLTIVQNLSFSKELDGVVPNSIEYCIVQDADRLDAIGAIGIARTFSYGGVKARAFFDELTDPLEFSNAAKYKDTPSPTINHFFEKLLLLKNKMKTATGKTMAAQRHQYMVTYLKQFFSETYFSSNEQKDKWLNYLSKHL